MSLTHHARYEAPENARAAGFAFSTAIVPSRVLGVSGWFPGAGGTALGGDCLRHLNALAAQCMERWQDELPPGHEVILEAFKTLNACLAESGGGFSGSVAAFFHDSTERRLSFTVFGSMGLAVLEGESLEFLSRGDDGGGFPAAHEPLVRVRLLKPGARVILFSPSLAEKLGAPDAGGVAKILENSDAVLREAFSGPLPDAGLGLVLSGEVEDSELPAGTGLLPERLKSEALHLSELNGRVVDLQELADDLLSLVHLALRQASLPGELKAALAVLQKAAAGIEGKVEALDRKADDIGGAVKSPPSAPGAGPAPTVFSVARAIRGDVEEAKRSHSADLSKIQTMLSDLLSKVAGPPVVVQPAPNLSWLRQALNNIEYKLDRLDGPVAGGARPGAQTQAEWLKELKALAVERKVAADGDFDHRILSFLNQLRKKRRQICKVTENSKIVTIIISGSRYELPSNNIKQSIKECLENDSFPDAADFLDLYKSLDGLKHYESGVIAEFISNSKILSTISLHWVTILLIGIICFMIYARMHVAPEQAPTIFGQNVENAYGTTSKGMRLIGIEYPADEYDPQKRQVKVFIQQTIPPQATPREPRRSPSRQGREEAADRPSLPAALSDLLDLMGISQEVYYKETDCLAKALKAGAARLPVREAAELALAGCKVNGKTELLVRRQAWMLQDEVSRKDFNAYLNGLWFQASLLGGDVPLTGVVGAQTVDRFNEVFGSAPGASFVMDEIFRNNLMRKPADGAGGVG